MKLIITLCSFGFLCTLIIRVSSNCVDNNQHCASWAQKGECSSNPGYMLKSCRKSCNQCGGSNDCRDKNSYCSSWANSGECQRNPDYMSENCKKSCNQCGTPNPDPNPQPPTNCPTYRGPPYSGTIFNFPNVVKATDPTSYTGIRYLKQEIANNPQMFDGRCNVGFRSYNAYQFSASYSDHSSVIFRVNPEFGYSEAHRVADKYAKELGRIPEIFRSRVDYFDLNRGGDSCSRGGGNWDLRSLSLNTDYAVNVCESQGILEELFIHEGSHASLDGAHLYTNAWSSARSSDRNRYISTYAQGNPNREDVTESVLPWLAVRYRANRIQANDKKIIECTIPNRLAYFDRNIAIRFP